MTRYFIEENSADAVNGRLVEDAALRRRHVMVWHLCREVYDEIILDGI